MTAGNKIVAELRERIAEFDRLPTDKKYLARQFAIISVLSVLVLLGLLSHFNKPSEDGLYSHYDRVQMLRKIDEINR